MTSATATERDAARTSAGLRNERLYDRFWSECPDFARYNPGARHRRRIIAELLRALPGSSLLDVGCGDGTLLASLCAELPGVRSFTGADLSSETVRSNRARLPGVRFEVLDIAAGALDETFDLVVCSEVLEHLDDRGPAMRHLAAMVAPGGHLLVTTPTGRVFATEKAFGHTTHPTVGELRALGEAAGLSLASSRVWGFPTYRALKWATNVNTEWALRNFGSGRYSPAAKLVSTALYYANFLNFAADPRGCQIFALFARPAR